MPDTWFTSDTHFGHKNILIFEPVARPFANLDEMHEVLINNWNSVVKKQDTVFHLGDFCFGKRWIDIAGRLNGIKRLVMGNHDTYPALSYLKYFSKVHGVAFWDKCILSHIPVHQRNLKGLSNLSVHGHLHSKRVLQEQYEVIKLKSHFGETVTAIFTSTPPLMVEDMSYFNVSVEQNNLMPFSADVIRDRIKLLEEIE